MFSWTLTPQAPHRRPTRFELVMAVVALALVAGGVWLLFGPQHRPHPATTATTRPALSAGPGRSSIRGTTSPRRVVQGGVDLSGVAWRDFHGVRLPYSSANGPAVTHGDRAWGFADTPGGAVFAAVHIGVRANAQWGPDIYGPTVAGQVDGPDKAALEDQLDSAYAQLADGTGDSSGGPVGRAYAVEEGFRVESFTPDAATVDVVTAGPGNDGTTVRAATRIQLIWRGSDRPGSGQRGDWRVLAPPGGDWGASAHVITSLDGYQSFGDQTSGRSGQGGGS